MEDVQKKFEGFAQKPVPRILVTQYGDSIRPFAKGLFNASESHWYNAAPDKHIIELILKDTAITMVQRRSYNLVVVDFGDRLYLQNGFGRGAPSYLQALSTNAKSRKVPVFALADKDSLNMPELWTALGENTMFFMEKPVEIPTIKMTLETCVKIAAKQRKPTIRVENPPQYFFEQLRKEGQKYSNKTSFAFREKQLELIDHPSVPYAVRADLELLFNTVSKEWFDISPMIEDDLGKLHLKLMEWMLVSSARKDGKKSTYELLA